MKLNEISNKMRPENISLGGAVQDWAINTNKEPQLWGLRKFQARLAGCLAKPLARIADVVLHVGLGLTKCVAGVFVKPIRLALASDKKNFQTNFCVSQGVHHLALAVLYAIDCPISCILNFISPQIYELPKYVKDKTAPKEQVDELGGFYGTMNNPDNKKVLDDLREKSRNNAENKEANSVSNPSLTYKNITLEDVEKLGAPPPPPSEDE